MPRDAAEDFSPSLTSLGYGKFIAYALPLMLFYCLLFFALEAFNFFNWENWLISSFTSALLTWVLVMTIEQVKRNKTA